MQKARFITFEGGEGVGKTTQAIKLQSFLTSKNINVTLTREPGGSSNGEKIRKLLVKDETQAWDPLSEYLLFSAARREHLVNTIWPALRRGCWVVCDRFYDSSRAYQGAGHDLNEEFIEIIYKEIANGFQPDLTLVLNLNVSKGLKRASIRNQAKNTVEDRFEQLPVEFHERVRQAFTGFTSQEPERYLVIDATPTVEEISQYINSFISEKFLNES